MEAFNKELAKLLFKPMDAQELQDPEKVSTIWVKNLNKTVKKMNNTVSSMIGMKPKDAIKLDTFHLTKNIDTFIKLVNNMEIKKDGQQTSFEAKILTDLIELYKTQVIASCTICDTDLIELCK